LERFIASVHAGFLDIGWSRGLDRFCRRLYAECFLNESIMLQWFFISLAPGRELVERCVRERREGR